MSSTNKKSISEKLIGSESNSIYDFYTISLILLACIYDKDKFSVLPFDNLHFTPEGEQLFNDLKNYYTENTFEEEITDELIKLGILTELYHDFLYVDIEKTDLNEIENFISQKIQSNEIIFPWIYGRVLYDKYFDDFDTQEDSLGYPDTLKLLSGTYQGVFQLKNYIIGPFGLLKSNTSRHLRPRLKISLWHCSDPSCKHTHEVQLYNDSNNPLLDIVDTIRSFNNSVAPIDYHELYKDELTTAEDYYNNQSLMNVCDFIVNSFGTTELQNILAELINNGSIRKKLPSNVLQKGDGKALVTPLNKSQCFQLILLEQDSEIVKQTEKLIKNGTIEIPPTEVRNIMTAKPWGSYGISYECNKLGIRALSKKSISTIRLKHFITEIYSDPDLKSQLEWKLRLYKGDDFTEKFGFYILNEDPRKIIRDSVLSGPTQLNNAINLLSGHFSIPESIEEENFYIDKILWKLGFEIPIFPNTLNKYNEYFNKLRDINLRFNQFDETTKEEIRGASVNLFVSLEEILEQTLSFITWVLLSDHYIDTKFKYTYEDAREFMVDKLDGFEYKTGEFLSLDKTGKNTLFPLIEGFNALIKVCESLITKRSELLRQPFQKPDFSSVDHLRTFYLESTIYVLDIKPNDYELLKQSLSSISHEFSRNNVLSIRNRLQHKRDTFPTQLEISQALDGIQSIIVMLEETNIYPNVFLLNHIKVDNYSRAVFFYRNSRGIEIPVHKTNEFDGFNLPDLKLPQIILPKITIGRTIHPTRFEYLERSSYQKYWKGFPRKKKIEKN